MTLTADNRTIGSNGAVYY